MKIDTALRVANLVLSAVNIGLFCLWWSMIRKDAMPPTADGAAAYALNQVSVQVTVMGVMIALGAILIAGLGVFGFQTILERAEATADKTAKETIAQLVENHRKDPFAALSKTPVGPLPVPGNMQSAED